MAIVYLPGSSRPDGKLNWPLSSVTTVVAMVEPSFLALTSTPSITGSWAEDTLPLSAAAFCAWASANPAAKLVPRLRPATSQNCFNRMFASQRGFAQLMAYHAAHRQPACPQRWCYARPGVGPGVKKMAGTAPAILVASETPDQSSVSTLTIEAPL